MMDKLVLVGVISAAHGIKGDVKIRSFSDNPLNLTKQKLFDKTFNEIKLVNSKLFQNKYIIANIGSKDRNHAEQQIGTELYQQPEELKSTQENEFYIFELENKIVESHEGQILGKVKAVHNFGAGDIIEIIFDDQKCLMYPFDLDHFPKVTKDRIVFNLNLK